ncbi:MAG: YidH family protein [Pirellulaceae bacterium]
MSDDPRVPLAQERTDLAQFRTLWAAERTLMAWMRTSLAMVSFGFAIDKLFAFLEQTDRAARLGAGYYWLGLCLVIAGILLLGMATVEHRRIVGQLRRAAGGGSSRISLPLFGAGLVLAISTVALLLVLLRWPY